MEQPEGVGGKDALIAELRLRITALEEENQRLQRLVLNASGSRDDNSQEEERKHDMLWPIRMQLLKTSQEQEHEVEGERKEDVVEESSLPVKDLAVASPVHAPLPQSSSPMTQREKIINEIIDTEEKFVADLTLLQHLFRNPIRAQVIEEGRPGGILSKSQFISIFSNSETILYLNAQFLLELKNRRNKWEPSNSTVGDLFLSYAPLFKLYGEFCANLPMAFATLKHLKSAAPQFLAVLQLIERLPDLRRLQLESFLSLPMQRVPRYVLFLETLNKHTDAAHPDKSLVAQALIKMRLIASEINQSVDTLEKSHKLMEIKLSVSGVPFELLVPSRHFVRSGVFSKITSKFVLQDHYYLFSDLLMYCGTTPLGAQGLYYKGHIMLNTAWLRDLPDSPYVKHLLQLVAPLKTYTFYWESLEEKKEWLKSIGKCIDALVSVDPNLVLRRGKVRVREPSSSFYSVLRDLFSYRPEEIDSTLNDDDENLDSFLLIDESGGEHKTVLANDESDEEEKEEVNDASPPIDAEDSTFNEFLYWKLQ